jgi:hypothetical protein
VAQHDKETIEFVNSNVESSVIVLSQKVGDSTKVSLHNSFELLGTECEPVIGASSINMNVENISLEKENLACNTLNFS